MSNQSPTAQSGPSANTQDCTIFLPTLRQARNVLEALGWDFDGDETLDAGRMMASLNHVAENAQYYRDKQLQALTEEVRLSLSPAKFAPTEAPPAGARDAYPAYLVERMVLCGDRNDSRIVDGRIYDPRKPSFWADGAQEMHRVTPLEAALTGKADGWDAMTKAVMDLKMRHVDDHQGDIYHALQSLIVKFGKPWDGKLTEATQPAATGAVADAEIRAMYVDQHGTDAGWLGIEGSYFIAGVQAARRAALAARPAPVVGDEKAAVEFYASNPSAALFDLRKRIAARPGGDAPIGWVKIDNDRCVIDFTNRMPIANGWRDNPRNIVHPVYTHPAQAGGTT